MRGTGIKRWTSGVYQIQSKVMPDRLYIGGSSDISKRWLYHIEALRLNKHHSKKMQSHFNEYGESDFVLSVLETCIPQYLIEREQHYLNVLDPYFNIFKVAGSGMGYRHSKEALLKIGEASRDRNVGRIQSEDTRNKIRLAMIRVWQERKANNGRS